MFSSSVLAVSQHPQVRRLVTTNRASRRLVGRFIAGDDLETALGAIRALVARGLLVTVDHLGEDVTDAADAVATRDAYVALLDRVDGLGLALRCELCQADGYTPDKALMDRMVAEGLKGDLVVDGKPMGLILNVGGYYKNVITLAPSLEITKDEIDLALKLLDMLLKRCLEA